MINEIKQFIVQDLLKKTSDYQLDSDEELLLSGMIDSLGIMLLVSFIADNLGYEVSPNEVTIENFSTVKTLVDFLETKI